MRNDEAKERERAEKYGCDGKCYFDTGMCGGVDTCPETRTVEWLATLFACLTIISTPILIIAGIVFAILYF